jgi:hypothetical protein
MMVTMMSTEAINDDGWVGMDGGGGDSFDFNGSHVDGDSDNDNGGDDNGYRDGDDGDDGQ